MGIEVRPAIGRWDDFASFMMPRSLWDVRSLHGL
jgi:hypothetical protein